MILENFRIPSSTEGENLNCYRWMPDEKPVAALQIVHGMAEHILRYSDFATYMNSLGFAVYGHDHMGHGGTSEEKGFIAEEDGDKVLVNDMAIVNRRMLSDLPDIPHFVMGHSMGSFVTRRFLTLHGKGLNGAVIMGTGNQSGAAVAAGRTMAKIMCAVSGKHKRSKMLDNLAFGGYDKKFTEPDLPNRWLSRDPESVKAYNADPGCGFKFTNAAFRDLFTLIGGLVKCKGLENMPKDLPILFVSGGDDPVGEFGKGVEQAKSNLEKVGLTPEIILYPGMRHEILNEIGNRKVYTDVGEWLQSKI